MELTRNDYNDIVDLMDNDSSSVEYEKDGETLYIEYEVELDGYVEDDYLNGTDAWITTRAIVVITNTKCFDEEGKETECKVDTRLLEKLYERELKTL